MCKLQYVHPGKYIIHSLPWDCESSVSLSFLVKAVYKYLIQSLEELMKWKRGTLGTGVTFLLLLLIPRESDRWKRRLVCQTGRLSNRGLELPPCKQHIKASNALWFFACTLSSPPNMTPLSPSVSLSALLWLSNTFSGSISLLSWFFQAFLVLAALPLPSLVPQLANTELFVGYFLSLPLTCHRDSTNPITQNCPFTIHCVFTVSPPHPLCWVILRDEKWWSRGGDHGLPV